MNTSKKIGDVLELFLHKGKVKTYGVQMNKSLFNEALRFYRIYDTTLYNLIIESLEKNESFLNNIYFTYDYSRNAYYCPKQILYMLENLRVENQGGAFRYKKVPIQTNLQALAISHRYIMQLNKQGILTAKNDTTIVTFKDNDKIFDTGVFDNQDSDFHYLTSNKDRYALSKSLTKNDIFLIDTVFETDFYQKFGYVNNMLEKNRFLFKLKKFFFAFKKPQRAF